MTEKYKFYNSKIYDLNKKLSQKPYKYIYKEIMPKKLFDKLQKEIYLLNQKRIAKDWDKIVFDLGNVLIKFDKDTYLEEKLPKEKREAYNDILELKNIKGNAK